ncbi:MAG: cardiolipin synthase [Sphingobacteriia bacterium]|jgi:cardiolipin synthase A/B|nr:cardiolipin synthase [Sphingobacteriia bacterium]
MDWPISDIIYWVAVIFIVYTIVSVIGVILLENRNPLNSISWIIILIMLPVAGLILYFFLGQNFRRKKIISKRSIKRIAIEALMDTKYDDIGLPDETQKIIRLLSNNSKSPLYEITQIKLYDNGRDTFEAMLADIREAKNHIHIEFYIIENDVIGNALRELLIQKAQEGVRIRVIYDYLGGLKLNKKFLHSMTKVGIYIQPFLPAHPSIGFSKINYRNHRKLVIIDGKIGYTGGINVASRYLEGNQLGLWRDTQVRLEGPVVYGMQNAFLIDWYFVDNKPITDQKYYPEIAKKDTGKYGQVVTSGPDTDWENIMQGIVTMINDAKKYIYIHTPYFLPTESICMALETAALCGIDVRLMLPEKSDTKLVAQASHSYLEHLMEAGVRVFFYQHNFLHSKAIVVDDMISTIGTANMDIRSYEQNFELNVFLYDQRTATQLTRLFKKDLRMCREIHLNSWKKRKKSKKMVESLARLFSPIL